MDKIFSKYEKLFRDKTAFEKKMLGIAVRESISQKSKTEIEHYRDIPAINSALSNVQAVHHFLKGVREDCFTIRSALNRKVNKEKFNEGKIEILRATLNKLNSLFDLIEQLQSYYPKLSDKAFKQLWSEFYASSTPYIPLRKLARLDYLEVQKFVLDDSKLENPVDRILKILYPSKDNNKLNTYSYPLAVCLADFEYLFSQIYKEHINFWMVLYKPQIISGANGKDRIVLAFKNEKVDTLWDTKLNLDAIYVNDVFEGIKTYFDARFHEKLSAFLNNQLFDGRIQFDGDWKLLLDVFFRLKTFGWISRHDNDTLFNLVKDKFCFCSKNGQKPKDFTPYHLNEIKRRINYLDKNKALAIKDLPCRTERAIRPIPSHSSQSSTKRN